MSLTRLETSAAVIQADEIDSGKIVSKCVCRNAANVIDGNGRLGTMCDNDKVKM